MKRASAFRLASALSAAGTVEEVDEAIRSRLPEVLDAASARLGIVDRDTNSVRLGQPRASRSPISARYQHFSLEGRAPLIEAVRTGRLVIVRNHDDWRAMASPAVVDDIVAAGVVTTACMPMVDGSGSVVAVLAVAWSDEVEVDHAAVAALQTLAELCQRTLERARATDRTTKRAGRLAHLAKLLADAMTVDEALETVTANGADPVATTATSIGLVDHDAGVLRTHHGQSVDDEVREQYADPPLDAPLVFTEAARTGRAVYVRSYGDYRARYPDSAAVIAQLGVGARAALPVRTSAGEVIGSIVHAWAGPREFGDALVSTLTTIADMAGQAIERASLVERIQRDAARSEALADLAERLATAHTTDEVADVVACRAAAVAGADSANVALLDRDAGVLQVHHNMTLDRAVQERDRSVPLDALLPHADVVRDGTIRVFDDLEQFGASYPHLVDELKGAGRQSCAVLPLPDSHGRPVGAVGFAWTDVMHLDDEARARLQGIANLCAQALERTQLSDAEHHLIRTLQDSVLAPLPSRAGLDAAARHLPAARHIGMGGDWYQGIELDEHRYAVIVGDVAGHGLTAVGEMAQLRAILGALVGLGTPLGEVFRQTTELLRAGDRLVTATAVVALLDTTTDTLAYATAGHPPPLLRAPDGTVTVLDDYRQPLLGVPLEDTARAGRAPFPRGSTLVVYTDGLIERRHEPMDRSIRRLVDKLRSATEPTAEALADSLVSSHVSDREPDDDIAIVVVRREA